MIKRTIASIVVGFGLMATILNAAGVVGFGRAPLTLIFLLIGPGLSIAMLLELRDRMVELCVVFASSLALDTFVAQALVWAHIWHPTIGLLSIVLLTLLLVTISWRRAPARARSAIR